MRHIALIASALGLATSASAQDCPTIKNDLDRLACYDRESGVTPKVTETPNESPWKVRTKSSPFDDTTSVYLDVDSDDVLSCGFLQNETATLMVRCHENTTSIYLSTECHLTDIQSYGRVDVRLDSDPAFDIGMDASTNNRALGLWRGNKAIPFIKGMFGKQKMTVRFTPFNENAVTATFDIANLEDVIQPLRESCGW